MLNLFFVVIAGAIFAYLSKKNILWGLALIIIFLPSYLWRFKILSLPSTFLELMIIILFFIFLVYKQGYKFFLKPNLGRQKKWFLILIFWLIISLLAWFYSPSLKALGLWRAYFLEPLLFFVMLMASLKNSKDYQLLVKAIAILIFWLAIFAIVQNFMGSNLPAAYDYPRVKRLTSVFSYPNALSLLTAGASGFLLAYYFFRKKDWEYIVIGILGLFLSWWSVSQGALVAVVFSFGLLLAVKIYQGLKNQKHRILYFVFLLLLLFFIFNTQTARSFYQQLFHPVLDLQATSIEIRSSQWQETWALLKDNWFRGAGLNAYQLKLIPYHRTTWLEIFLYPHNIFLNFWVELGLLGLLGFLAIIYFIAREIRNLFRQKNNLRWPLLMFWLIWLMHGLVDVPYFKNDLSLLFFLFLALTIKAKYNDNDLQTKQILV